jgi:hypothetical protein
MGAGSMLGAGLDDHHHRYVRRKQPPGGSRAAADFVWDFQIIPGCKPGQQRTTSTMSNVPRQLATRKPVCNRVRFVRVVGFRRRLKTGRPFVVVVQRLERVGLRSGR